MSRAEVEYLEGIIKSLTGEDLPPLHGLSRTESIIVWRLERAGGGIVTYKKLLDATSWDKADPPYETTLKVQIFRIREKRKDIGDRIYNVRGLGYGLRPV